jgi:hypothetical protein
VLKIGQIGRNNHQFDSFTAKTKKAALKSAAFLTIRDYSHIGSKRD